MGRGRRQRLHLPSGGDSLRVGTPTVRVTEAPPQPPKPTMFTLLPDLETAGTTGSKNGPSGRDVHGTFDKLSSLTETHSFLIASRWQKRNAPSRSKVLSRAFTATFCAGAVKFAERIPEKRVLLSQKLLDANEYPKYWDGKGNGGVCLDKVYELLFGFINLEQLATHPAPLLHLIHSRRVKEPFELARVDFLTSVLPILTALGLDKSQENRIEASLAPPGTKSEIAKLIPGAREEYGDILEWETRTDDFMAGLTAKKICTLEEAVYLFRWQKYVTEFCLDCVTDILGEDADIAPGSRFTGGPESLLIQTNQQQEPVATAYGGISSGGVPGEFSWKTSLTQALSALRRAEDHLDLIRTDADYLLYQVKLRTDHYPGNVRSTSGTSGDPASAEAVAGALKTVTNEAYARCVVWSNIVRLFEEAEQLYATSDWSSSNEAIDDKVWGIGALLELLRSELEHDVRYSAFAGPALRDYFRRLPDKESVITIKTPEEVFAADPVNALLMCLCPGSKGSKYERLSFKVICEEIEHLLLREPDRKGTVHPWVMERLSEAAVVFELQTTVFLHAPEYLPRDSFELLNKINDAAAEFAEAWPKVDLSLVIGEGQDPRGLEKLKDVVKAEGGLARFWSTMDVQVSNKSEITLEAWKEKHGGTLARSRRGRWHWQGQMWLLGRPVEDDSKKTDEGLKGLPPLLTLGGLFDDSEGYGNGSPTLPFRLPTASAGRKPSSSEKIKENLSQNLAQLKIDQSSKPAETNHTQTPPQPTKPAKPKRAQVLNETTFVDPQPHDEPEQQPKAPKVKTRPTPAPQEIQVQEEEAVKYADDATVFISVTKRVLAGLKALAAGATLAWKEFLHVMSGLKFRVEHVGGSAVRFVPEDEGDEPITIHRPHPDANFSKFESLWTYKRLVRSYGWTLDRFKVA